MHSNPEVTPSKILSRLGHTLPVSGTWLWTIERQLTLSDTLYQQLIDYMTKSKPLNLLLSTKVHINCLYLPIVSGGEVSLIMLCTKAVHLRQYYAHYIAHPISAAKVVFSIITGEG